MAKDMKILIVILLFSTLLEVNSDTTSPLRTEYKWKYFEYIWDSVEQKRYYEAVRLYDPDSYFIPIDVDRSLDGRTFLTVIRGPGIPATLHTVSDQLSESGPLLRPYPDWSWYNTHDPCAGIISVFRIAIDDCNVLWVIDTGQMNGIYICPAKLLAFELYTDKLLYKEVLNDSIAYNFDGRGMLVTPIVETEGPQCQNTTLYIADSQGNALIVWQSPHKIVRLKYDRFFAPDPQYNTYIIAGESIKLDYGVTGMAVSPRFGQYDERYLVFRPMSSLSFFQADTSRLKNVSKGGKVFYEQAKDVISSQATAQAFASDGTLFYGLTTDLAIGCWNIKNPKEFKPIVFDDDRLQFPSGMKVIPHTYKPQDEYLLVLSNRMQKILNNSSDPDEYKFHVLRASVKELNNRGRCNKNV